MKQLPTPDRGTPVDTQLIYDMVSAINDIAKQVSAGTYSTTTIHGEVDHSVRTGDARIYGTFVKMVDKTVPANGKIELTASLGGTFKYPPIVVATPATYRVTTNSTSTAPPPTWALAGCLLPAR